MLNPSIDANIQMIEQAFTDCGDFVGRKFSVGSGNIFLYIAYLDMMSNRDLIDLVLMKYLLKLDINTKDRLNKTGRELLTLLKDNGLPTADLKESSDMNGIMHNVLTGDTVIFIDGCEEALVIATKGFPNRGVTSCETEVVVQGPKEAFSEAFRINTALVRRRIRDTRLKVKQLTVGRRSQSDIALMYMEGIARPAIIKAVEERIKAIDIDGIPDSGFLEQFIEDKWMSPFPQAQLTERPDKAAASILEGRIVIVVDNSPFVLIVPVTMQVFFQSSEDYYNRWPFMSLVRLIRYAAAFMAVALPGFYIAAAVYHPSMIPLLLISKMAAAREAVPFPAVVEIFLMDAAFELLREAGIRLPGAAGGTIGIVGGLIIGQAAVEAGLVSPIVVIIVALTGIASFTIPHVSLVNGFRLVKYAVLLLSAILGLLGFWAGLVLALIHLASLLSFGVPYLMPFAAGELNGYNDIEDSIVRLPLFTMKRRPFFAAPGSEQRISTRRANKSANSK